MPDHCPQCGHEADEFREGVCVPCCVENQMALDQFNFDYDRWAGMSAAERDREIRNAE